MLLYFFDLPLFMYLHVFIENLFIFLIGHIILILTFWIYSKAKNLALVLISALTFVTSHFVTPSKFAIPFALFNPFCTSQSKCHILSSNTYEFATYHCHICNLPTWYILQSLLLHFVIPIHKESKRSSNAALKIFLLIKFWWSLKKE